MIKCKAGQKAAVVQEYRVECNHGCKYFQDENQAVAFFSYKTACGFDAELWGVRHYYDEKGTLIRGEQILLDSEVNGDYISLF